MIHEVRSSVSRRRLLRGAAVAGAAASLPTWSGVARAQCTGVADIAAEEVQRIRDVVYGEVDGEPLLLEVLHPPAREAARPAVVIVHGGGFITGDRMSGIEHGTYLAQAGYVVFTIDYRLFALRGGVRINPWPAQLDDAQRAVRWVRANAATYGVDPKRIAAYGHSAGGTLAALLGVRETRDNSVAELADYSSRVNSVVDIAGEVDLTIPPQSDFVRKAIEDHLGGTPQEIPEVYHDYSAVSHIDEESVPFLILHGTKDRDVLVEHSRRLEAALHEAGVEVAYLELPDADHMIPAWWLMTGPWVLTFLSLHLHPER